MIVQTPRLTLRVFTLDDAALMRDVLNAPDFIRFVGDRGVHTLEQARQHITEKVLASQSENGFSMYHVSLRETGEAIGACGLIKRPGLDDVDIGYGFLPAFYGKGYASECANAVIQYARDVLGMRRVVGIVAPDHEASIHVLENAGLRFERMVTLPNAERAIKLFGIDF